MPALNFLTPLLTHGQLNWGRAFRAPIRTRDGRTLRTLSDVRAYLASLPTQVSNLPPWQNVAKLLVQTIHTECDVQVLRNEIASAVVLTRKAVRQSSRHPRSERRRRSPQASVFTPTDV
jgi:hypothetical protein